MEKQRKAEIIANNAVAKNDTGSPEVQVALLTERISVLTDHLSKNRHDYHSQRGLYKQVGQRRRLLDYLMKEHVDRYRKLIEKLGLRK